MTKIDTSGMRYVGSEHTQTRTASFSLAGQKSGKAETHEVKLSPEVEELRDKPSPEPEGYPLCEACENCPRKVCNCEDCPPWREWFREAWKTVTGNIKKENEK